MDEESKEWRELVPTQIIQTGPNTQIRISVVQHKTDTTIPVVLSVSKWSRYKTAEEKRLGIPLEQCIFRPGKGKLDKLSMPLEKMGELEEALQSLKKAMTPKRVVKLKAAQ